MALLSYRHMHVRTYVPMGKVYTRLMHYAFPICVTHCIHTYVPIYVRMYVCSV